jgi:probable rRNA maturation factor
MSRAAAIEVAIACPAWRKAVTGPASLCRRAARLALDNAPADSSASGAWAELSLVLADDALLRRLNRTYRGKDSPTNVLAFPAAGAERDMDGEAGDGEAGPPRLMGDVVVALETARAEAAREGKPLAHHLSHLVVHGTLHLLGYDHERQTDALRMERLEIATLKRLGVPNPYRARRSDGG